MEFYNSKQDIKVLGNSLNTLNKLLTACAKSYDLKSLSKADRFIWSVYSYVSNYTINCKEV